MKTTDRIFGTSAVGVLLGFFLVNGCNRASRDQAPSHPKAGAEKVVGTSATAKVVGTLAAPSAPTSAEPAQDDSAEYDKLAGTIDAATAPAPCDFSRHYRGTVGDSPWSVVLSRKGSSLEGHAAYDAGTGDIAIRGTVRADASVIMTEEQGGRFEGSCAADTGIISGTWKLGTSARPFVLKPRASAGVALVERRRIIGKAVEDQPSCHWDVRSPAVFGLGDPERTGRINTHLRVRFLGANEAEMERSVTACPAGVNNDVLGWYSIEANEQGLLSVVTNGYTYFGPAAHGDHTAAAAAISIDIPSGRRLNLTDIVTSSKAIRPAVKSCMKLVVDALEGGDEWWHERDIQGVPTDKDGEPVEESSPAFVPSSLREPSFLVLPDGLAVLIRGQSTATSFYELQGPVIQWGALIRAGALKTTSPVARLWAGAKPVGPNEPACTRFFVPKWAIPVKVSR